MTTAILGLALVACFAWAIIASTAAQEWKQAHDDERDRADRAASFSEDCLTENRELREQAEGRENVLAHWRAWAGRLERHIHDGRDFEDFAALLAEQEPTPVFDAAAEVEARRAAEFIDQEWLNLTTEERP